MTRPPVDRITTLPKWAQDYIGDLERRNAELTAAIKATSVTHSRAEFFMDNGFNMPATALPRHTGIRVKFSDSYLDLRMVDNQYNPNERFLRITGSKGVTIRPGSTNVIEVTP
jgi:hypothetical protein